MLRWAAVIAALLLGSIWTSTASAATLVVDDDRRQCPAAQYQRIQAAVDAAFAGDRVSVCAGGYREQVWIRPAKAGLVLEATPRRAAVILAPAQFTGLPRAMVVAAARVGPRGFRILGLLPPNPGCALITRSPTTRACRSAASWCASRTTRSTTSATTARAASASCGRRPAGAGAELRHRTGGDQRQPDQDDMQNGIIVEASGYPEDAVRIVGNEIAGAQTRPTTGIRVAQEGIVVAEDNLIHSNRGPGIDLAGVFAGGDEIRGNRIRGNGSGIEIDPIRDGGPLIEGNDISANRSHGIVDGGGYVGGTVNLDNIVRDNVGHGLLLEGYGISPGIVERNQVLRNRLDGIHLGDTFGYQLSFNTALDNRLFDCRDTTTGGCTAGTNNTWTANRGRTSSPAGLCVPQVASASG